jgi:hypothetical protein
MLVMGWLLNRIENLRYLLNPSDSNKIFLVSGSLIAENRDPGNELDSKLKLFHIINR